MKKHIKYDPGKQIQCEVEINNCTFIGNSAEIYGGALSTGWSYDYMELTVNNCNFEGNEAPNGGAIQANGLNILIKDSNFKDNRVTENGGAIYVRAEDVSIPKPDGWFPRSRILGKAKLIKRGKTTIDCDNPKWQKRAARWCALWRLRPLLMLPHRAVDKLERIKNKQVSHGNK